MTINQIIFQSTLIRIINQELSKICVSTYLFKRPAESSFARSRGIFYEVTSTDFIFTRACRFHLYGRQCTCLLLYYISRESKRGPEWANGSSIWNSRAKLSRQFVLEIDVMSARTGQDTGLLYLPRCRTRAKRIPEQS